MRRRAGLSRAIILDLFDHWDEWPAMLRGGNCDIKYACEIWGHYSILVSNWSSISNILYGTYHMHLRSISGIWRYIRGHAVKYPVSGLVVSRLDLFNALLNGLPY